MMNLPVGEIAALMAAFSFSVTSLCFTFAGRKLNAITTLALTLPISWLSMILVHQVSLGEFFPIHAAPERWFYLGMSGFLAFVVSSYFMLNAFQYIGPRLSTLIASFAPVLGAILGWIFLGQTLPPHSMIGIFVVLFGIVWVVAERNGGNSGIENPNLRRGIFSACLATLMQASAFVFSSQGVTGDFSPFSGSLIRVTVGLISIWVLVAFQGNVKTTVALYKQDLQVFLQLTGAAISGPVIGASFLLFAFQFVPIGVATTLSQTTSIILIPLSYFIFKERISLRAIVGTIVAIIGIAIMFS